MANMKKYLLMGLCIVLTAVIAVSGTLAYLMDTDSDVNVMQVGTVKIDQLEQERDANGDLVDFTQDKPAIPAVYKEITWADQGNGVTVNGVEYKVFNSNMRNVLDKIVTVNNTGKSDAFVRTVVAIEAPDFDPDNLIHINYNGTDCKVTATANAQIAGVDYVIFSFTYNKALEAGAKSAPSLVQLFLDKKATNDYAEQLGDTWKVLVVSQAVQADGFDSAAEALDEAFGVISANNHPWMPQSVTNADELAAAMNISVAQATLGNDIVADGDLTIEEDSDLKIDLNNKVLSDVDYVEAHSGSTFTLENGTLKSGSALDYGVIALDGSDVVLNDVDVMSAGGGIAAVNGAYVEVNGGTVDVSTTSTSGRYNVYAEGEGAKVVINDGTFSFSKTLNQKRAYVYAGEGTTVIINGGTFGPASTRSGYTAGILGDGEVIITGGTFGFDPSAWVAEGYEAVKTGSTWTVNAK